MKLTRVAWGKWSAGMVLILLGVQMPVLINVDNFGVLRLLEQGLREWEKIDILAAALRLVILNSLRSFPHYIGAFFVTEAFSVEIRGRKSGWPNVFVVAGLIFGVYQAIRVFHGIHYDFGGPAMILVTLQILLWKVEYSYISPRKKIPMMMAFILAFQFLDVLPLLGHLPFGRGETSVNIKAAAELLECTKLLNSMATALFVSCLLVGALLFLVLREENNLWKIHELQEQNEAIRMEAWARERDSRATRELQHLVHDLKSPLTAIQTLAGVLQYKCTRPEQETEREYLRRIESSVEYMSNMISEILYEDRRLPIRVGKLLDMVLAQISPAGYAGAVRVDNRAEDAVIRVNSLRFVRALINLVENAYHARRDDEIQIIIHAHLESGEGDERVRITVSDNGKGISPEELERVWERGVSIRGSSGLGLSFVRDVVERSEGEIQIQSALNQGTQVTILLPKGEAEHE